MATAKKSEPQYLEHRYYDVRVSRVVRYRGSYLRPRGSYRIKGKALADLPADAIVSTDIVAE